MVSVNTKLVGCEAESATAARTSFVVTIALTGLERSHKLCLRLVAAPDFIPSA
jgi:hypothetical protein